MTYVQVSKLTIIGLNNSIWTNAGILLIWTLGTEFCEILNEIENVFENVVCEMVSILSPPQYVIQVFISEVPLPVHTEKLPFHLGPCKISANEKARYMCNALSHSLTGLAEP